MKLQSYVNEDGKLKIQLQCKSYTLDGSSSICQYMGLYSDDLVKILQANGAVFERVKYGYGLDYNKYHFPTQDKVDAALAALNPIFDAYQANEKHKIKIKKEIAKGKDTNIYILESTNFNENTKSIKISSYIGLKKNNTMFNFYYNSGSTTNSYYVCKLPQSYAKEIIKEFEKCKFDDFVDAILKVREIAEPYIIMQKITGE